MVESTRLGLMAGFLATLFISILYLSDPVLLISGYERLTLLLFFGAIVYGISRERQTNLTPHKLEDLLQKDANQEEVVETDFAAFGDLLRTGFRIYLIAYFVKFFFVYFLYNFYDPSLIEMVKEANVEIFKLHRNPNETDLIFQQKLDFFKSGDFGPRFSDVLGIGIELILGFMMAFVVAIFFKRERPDY